MTGERITSQGGVLVIGGEKKLAEGGYPLQLQKNHRGITTKNWVSVIKNKRKNIAKGRGFEFRPDCSEEYV